MLVVTGFSYFQLSWVRQFSGRPINGSSSSFCWFYIHRVRRETTEAGVKGVRKWSNHRELESGHSLRWSAGGLRETKRQEEEKEEGQRQKFWVTREWQRKEKGEKRFINSSILPLLKDNASQIEPSVKNVIFLFLCCVLDVKEEERSGRRWRWWSRAEQDTYPLRARQTGRWFECFYSFFAVCHQYIVFFSHICFFDCRKGTDPSTGSFKPAHQAAPKVKHLCLFSEYKIVVYLSD